MLVRALTLAAVVAVTACDPSVEGMYDVVEYSADQTRCQGVAPSTPEFRYVRLGQGLTPVDGEYPWQLDLCATAEEWTCEDAFELLPNAGAAEGYREIGGFVFESSSSCELHFSEETLVIDGDTITWRLERRLGSESDPALCTEVEALQRGRSMGCDGYREIIARAVDGG